MCKSFEDRRKKGGSQTGGSSSREHPSCLLVTCRCRTSRGPQAGSAGGATVWSQTRRMPTAQECSPLSACYRRGVVYVSTTKTTSAGVSALVALIKSLSPKSSSNTVRSPTFTLSLFHSLSLSLSVFRACFWWVEYLL